MALVSPNIGYYGGPFDDTISHQGKTYRRGNTQGVTPNHAQISNVKLKEGRFISEQDDQFRRNVMVVGVNAAQALFPDQPDRLVGTEVKMGGYIWEIIGVLEKRKNTFLGENEEDNAVLVPFRTGLQVAPARLYLRINIQAKTGMREAAIDQVEEILRARRSVRFSQPNDFDLTTADAFISLRSASAWSGCRHRLVGRPARRGSRDDIMPFVTERSRESECASNRRAPQGLGSHFSIEPRTLSVRRLPRASCSHFG